MPTRRAIRRPARRRIRLETDQRRAQLLELAKASFSSRAYDDVSIDDLAREARISKGLLYHYFPTKRDLYVAGLSEIAHELVAAITGVPEDLAPIERVRASLDAYLTHISRQARAFVSLMRGGIGSDPEVVAVVESVRTRLFERFLSGSPFAGLFTGDARFETAVRGWIGFVEAATIDWCTHPRLTQLELRELLTQILFEIVKVAAPSVFRVPS
ncbi:MAG: TetR/AcrR family transcriptional regulator [Deltaproteobacteria bacterium]|nr:TetR/AcrR family transcriptional regulator [Deltaproteobacteria bacterium]MCW5804838.1 TetR/AcrR family transcriptional regulator [Deltaproteobacteria bacterium]